MSSPKGRHRRPLHARPKRAVGLAAAACLVAGMAVYGQAAAAPRLSDTNSLSDPRHDEARRLLSGMGLYLTEDVKPEYPDLLQFKPTPEPPKKSPVKRVIERIKPKPKPKPKPSATAKPRPKAKKPAVVMTIAQKKEYARWYLAERGFANQFYAVDYIFTRESGWNHRADNPTSSAYGIPQSLPGSKMATAGSDWKTNPRTQIRWGIDYMISRYGSPAKAYQFWLSHHWY